MAVGARNIRGRVERPFTPECLDDGTVNYFTYLGGNGEDRVLRAAEGDAWINFVPDSLLPRSYNVQR